MSKTVQQGKGSKRRVGLVQWSRLERFSLLLVFLVLMIETLCVAWWLMTHPFD